MDRKRRCRTFAAIAVLLFSQTLAAVQLRNPNDDPVFGDAIAGERFGTSVAVDGTTAAIGSFQGHDPQGNLTGSVRVFTKQGGEWVSQATLVPPDGRSWDAFGAAVALEGDTLVVGASNYSRNEQYYVGAVYVFERNGSTWIHSQTLSRPEPSAGSHFGAVLALTGHTLAVGAPQTDIDGIESAGSVTVFERDAGEWHAAQTILTPAPFHLGTFGTALVFAGDALVIGADGENGRRGTVYSYARESGGWVMRQGIAGSEVEPGDGFGSSLAADDDRLLVGAPAFLRDSTGLVVEWRRQGGLWVEAATLRPPNEPNLRHFGIDIAHRGGDAWFIDAERRPPGQFTAAVDVFTYEPVNGLLALAVHASLPYAGSAGYGLGALATDGTDVFVGLPFRYAAPWSDAGEVVVIGPGGSQSSISNGVTAYFEYFGAAVMTTSRWLLVGSPGERRHSAASGAVFAYDLDDFHATPADVLIDPDGERRDYFGASLALSGETLLVGSPYDDESTGSVQAWEYSGSEWQRTARWTSPNPGYTFGSVLAADPATAVIGVPSETGSTGAAYVYERAGDGWLAPTRLSATAAAGNEIFGESVAVDGGILVVGSLKHETGWFMEPIRLDGAARVFEKGPSGWTEVAQLVRPASDAADGEFGGGVAVVGTTVFVTAVGLREVHVFQRAAGQWVWTQRIEAPASASSWFGARIRVMDGELWVAAPDYYGNERDTLYRYSGSGGSWRLVQSLHSSSPGQSDGFGSDFAVQDGLVFIGVRSADGYAPFVRLAGRVDIEAVNVFGSGFE